MTKVAIIGSGVVGATIAYEFSKREDLEITLFDRQTPASGCTSAALGVLMGIISRKTKGKAWRLRQASMQRYDSLITELETLTGQPLPYNRQGILKLRFDLDDQAKLERLVRKRQDAGWTLKLWGLAELQEKCPQIQQDHLVGAVYSPQDRQINPQALTQALVTAAQAKGVASHFNTEVKTVVPNPSTVQLDTTEGTFTYDWLVVTAGLGSMPLTQNYVPLHLRPVLGQALRLKLPETLGNPDFQPVITGGDVHLVPLGNAEYWLGATVEFPNEQDLVIAEAERLEAVKAEAIAFCPALAKGDIRHTWSGKRPRPEGQSAPVIQPLPDYPNVVLATGHYRNGVLLAPATAQAVQSMIDHHDY